MREMRSSVEEGQRVVSRSDAYVLVTAARNEELFIEETIRSVISQSLLPTRWVIVSDGSVDNTEKIVEKYAEAHNFIELVRLQPVQNRSFASKVYALGAAMERLTGGDYRFVGNLDADVSFEPSYFAQLMKRFEHDQALGLAGGYIYERWRGKFAARTANSIRSVAGAVQMFRRECYESVGGIRPLKYGGEDWCAEVMARMKGWRVEAFPELKVFHLKPLGAATGVLKYWYHQGFMDYSLGSHPLFVVVKCIRRLRSRPYGAGAFARLAGFVWAYHRREKRAVCDEFVKYLRREQKQRMFNLSREFF
jgi:glycosyltransferase involved in cell wall biosynthesis